MAKKPPPKPAPAPPPPPPPATTFMLGALLAASDRIFTPSHIEVIASPFISISSPDTAIASSFIGVITAFIHSVNSVSIGILIDKNPPPMPFAPNPPAVALKEGPLLAASAKLPTAPITASKFLVFMCIPSPESSSAISFIIGRISLMKLPNFANASAIPPRILNTEYKAPAAVNASIACPRYANCLPIPGFIVFAIAMNGFISSINADSCLPILGSCHIVIPANRDIIPIIPARTRSPLNDFGPNLLAALNAKQATERAPIRIAIAFAAFIASSAFFTLLASITIKYVIPVTTNISPAKDPIDPILTNLDVNANNENIPTIAPKASVAFLRSIGSTNANAIIEPAIMAIEADKAIIVLVFIFFANFVITSMPDNINPIPATAANAFANLGPSIILNNAIDPVISNIDAEKDKSSRPILPAL